MLESLFNKVATKLQVLQLYYKDTPTQVFSCKVCEIFKNTFSYKTPPVAASAFFKKVLFNSYFANLVMTYY